MLYYIVENAFYRLRKRKEKFSQNEKNPFKDETFVKEWWAPLWCHRRMETYPVRNFGKPQLKASDLYSENLNKREGQIDSTPVDIYFFHFDFKRPSMSKFN